MTTTPLPLWSHKHRRTFALYHNHGDQWRTRITLPETNIPKLQAGSSWLPPGSWLEYPFFWINPLQKNQLHVTLKFGDFPDFLGISLTKPPPFLGGQSSGQVPRTCSRFHLPRALDFSRRYRPPPPMKRDHIGEKCLSHRMHGILGMFSSHLVYYICIII